MSTHDRLTRLGLLHLADQPEALQQELVARLETKRLEDEAWHLEQVRIRAQRHREAFEQQLLQLAWKVCRRAEVQEGARLHMEVGQEPEAHTLIIDCAWRLETSTQTLCGSGDDPGPGGHPWDPVRGLEGLPLRSIHLRGPALDLVLEFEGDRTLRLFCNRTDPADPWGNYRLLGGVGHFTATSGGALRVEQA